MNGGSDCLLDPQALAELRALDPDGSQGLLQRLDQAWQRSLERLLPELDQALAAQDLDGLRRVAHTLKSSTANLAALHLSACWQTIEQRCKEGQAEELAGLVAQARSQTLQVHEALCAVA